MVFSHIFGVSLNPETRKKPKTIFFSFFENPTGFESGGLLLCGRRVSVLTKKESFYMRSFFFHILFGFMSLFLNQTKTSNCLHTIEGFSMK